jgi:hypothetical protein
MYNAVIKVVREQCGVVVTKEKIVSRCKTFDKHYEILSKILAESGFGWDNEKNILSIDSDDVWNRYVEVFPMSCQSNLQTCAYYVYYLPI